MKIHLVKYRVNGAVNIKMFLKLMDAVTFALEHRSKVTTRDTEEHFLQEIGGIISNSKVEGDEEE